MTDLPDSYQSCQPPQWLGQTEENPLWGGGGGVEAPPGAAFAPFAAAAGEAAGSDGLRVSQPSPGQSS